MVTKMIDKICITCGDKFRVNNRQYKLDKCIPCREVHYHKVIGNQNRSYKRGDYKTNMAAAKEARGICTKIGCNNPKGVGMHYLCDSCFKNDNSDNIY